MVTAKVSKNKIVDAYIVFSLFLIPSSFLGLVSFRFFYVPGLFDLRLLSWLLTLPLLIIYGHKLRALSKTTSGKILILVVLFIIVRFVISLTKGISFRESFTVFRMGFNSPISCLAFLCFFYSIDNERIERIFKGAIVLFTLNLVLYFVNYIGLNIYDNIGEITQETHQGISITRNLSGFPVYFSIFFALSIYLTLHSFRPLYISITLFALFVIYLSATRNFIITNLLILSIILVFFVLKPNAGFFKRSVQVFISLAFFVVVLITLKSDVYQFLKAKFDTTINVELKENKGTYAYRTRLIQTSIHEVESSGDILLGKGYTRYGEKGSYKFVLGGDTLVAPVIFCEGYLGLAIRIAPILYFLFFGLYQLKTPGINQYIGIAIIAVIVGSTINYVQTTIFFHYVEYLLFFYISQRYLMNLNTRE